MDTRAEGGHMELVFGRIDRVACAHAAPKNKLEDRMIIVSVNILTLAIAFPPFL